jgi:hypothetical protein
MYSRYIRQIAVYFDCCPDHLITEQLKPYFIKLVNNKSWISLLSLLLFVRSYETLGCLLPTQLTKLYSFNEQMA